MNPTIDATLAPAPAPARLVPDTRCAALVQQRDTWRYAGGRHGAFELHYSPRRCRRRAVRDGLCWQHLRVVGVARGV